MTPSYERNAFDVRPTYNACGRHLHINIIMHCMMTNLEETRWNHSSAIYANKLITILTIYFETTILPSVITTINVFMDQRVDLP